MAISRSSLSKTTDPKRGPVKEKKKLTPPKRGPKSKGVKRTKKPKTAAERKAAAKNQGKRQPVKKTGTYRF